ncbi:MAG: hypothetical protein HXY25_10005 [Alphaproteobacteria bacterium]|nr:hypothetical protein [Alphaproteobacteria bacterium]
MTKLTEVRLTEGSGDLVIELRSLKALPIEGVMTTLGQAIVPPEARVDPSVIRWRVRAAEARYILYGIITPAARLLLAPRYERRFLRNGELMSSRAGNPETVLTRKVNDGEWVGEPELVSIKCI